MAVLRSQVILPFFTNLPTDVITNVMHWETDDSTPVPDEAAFITPRLSAFYTDVYGSGRAANYVNWAGARIKIYNLADTPPRAPVIDAPLGIGITPSPSQLPTEVAVVLSYHADPVSGIPAGRLRNRIYLGGWATTLMVAGSVSTFPTIEAGARTTITAAASNLLAANTATLQWKILSQATGLAITSDIVGGHVDNTPDTQRRRGVLASARTLWT